MDSHNIEYDLNENTDRKIGNGYTSEESWRQDKSNPSRLSSDEQNSETKQAIELKEDSESKFIITSNPCRIAKTYKKYTTNAPPQRYPAKIREKVSYGICLCRIGNNGVQMLMIKKRTTYAFTSFVNGTYEHHDEKYLRKLFNNMTHTEKLLILHKDFDYMWKHTWMQDVKNLSGNRVGKFLDKKNKFRKLIDDGGRRLRCMINGSNNSDTLWEIPKGRKQMNERNLDAAMREFYEETNITPDDYTISWSATVINQSYIDGGTKYINYYYIAEPNKNIDGRMNFGNAHQISEVQAVQWVDKTTLKLLITNTRVQERTLKLYKRLKLCFKKNTAHIQLIQPNVASVP